MKLLIAGGGDSGKFAKWARYINGDSESGKGSVPQCQIPGSYYRRFIQSHFQASELASLPTGTVY